MEKNLTTFNLALIFLVITAFVAAFPTMLLWNWLMPELFGFKAITFWQALGINMLSGILFKSHGTSSSESSDRR